MNTLFSFRAEPPLASNRRMPVRPAAKWWVLYPLAPAVIAVALAVLLADHSPALVVGLAGIYLLVVLAILLASGRYWRCICYLSVALLVWTLHTARIAEQSLSRELAEPPAEYLAELRIVDDAAGPRASYLAEIVAIRRLEKSAEWLEMTNARLVLIVPGHELRWGQRVQVQGIIEQIPSERNPAVFDRKKWNHRRGAEIQLVATAPAEILSSAGWRDYLTQLRIRIKNQLTLGLDDEASAAVIPAIALGIKPPATSELMQVFRHSGALHVFAVSGLHVALVGLIVSVVLRWLRMPRWAILLLSLIVMVLYAGLTGFRPPAVRACLMAFLVILALMSRYRPALLNGLCASFLIVVLWDSHQLFMPGFQLSYGVLLAIILSASWWKKVYAPLAAIDEFMPRSLLDRWQLASLYCRRKMADALAVSSAAWLGSSPLTWVHFGILTPVSILISVPLLLCAFLILALSMVSLFVGMIWSPLSIPVNHVNGLIASGAKGSAELASKLPAGHFKDTSSWKNKVIIYDVADGGQAIYLGFGGGVLLDVGSEYFYRSQLRQSLFQLGAPVDSVIISHADINHYGALPLIAEDFPLQQVMVAHRQAENYLYQQCLDQLDARQLKLAERGMVLPLGEGILVEIIYLGDVDWPRADEQMMVVVLNWHGEKVMILSDVGMVTERAMKSSLPAEKLQADVIVREQNRWDLQGSEVFYQAVGAEQLILQGDRQPARNFPAGMAVWQQSQLGAVTLQMIDGKVTVSGHLSD